MSVVRRDAARRWSLVAGGVAVLCLSPVVIGAWPVADPGVDPATLRSRVLGSIAQPYQGYVESNGRIDLPDLPQLDDVTGLLAGTARIRTWYATPQAWRVAVLTPTGEQDTYRTHEGTLIWNYELNLVTGIVGELPIRLPWAADLTPPELARRLLAAAADDPVSRLAPRRIAGAVAAGFRVQPQDLASTIGRVDIWADPKTGLALRIEVGGRDSSAAVFISRFLDVRQKTPDPTVIVPVSPASAGFASTSAPDIAAALNSIASFPLPEILAGRPRVAAPNITGVGAYGSGLSTFVAVPLPGRLGGRAIGAAQDAHAAPVDFESGRGLALHTSVLSTLIVWSGERPNRQVFLLAGFVTPELLRSAGADLLAAATRGVS